MDADAVTQTDHRLAAPAVSVIVPAYGCAAFIADALHSLQAQTMADWEAIVVDDGSPDAVAAVVAGFAADPRIRLLATDNRGVATARNRALAVARAPLIATLDGDDRYEPPFLAEMMAMLAADPALAFVTCDATFFGSSRNEGRRFSDVTPQVPPVTLDRVLRRQFNVFCACLIHAPALRAVGGWNDDLRSAEDFDLWLRLLADGGRCGYVPRPLHWYRRRTGSLSSARLQLLGDVARVYDDVAARLAGRPEAETARAMRAGIDAEIAFERGEALVLAGDVGSGLALLDRARPRTDTLAWRAAMIGMRLVPAIAPRFMRWRMGEDAPR